MKKQCYNKNKIKKHISISYIQLCYHALYNDNSTQIRQVVNMSVNITESNNQNPIKHNLVWLIMYLRLF